MAMLNNQVVVFRGLGESDCGDPITESVSNARWGSHPGSAGSPHGGHGDAGAGSRVGDIEDLPGLVNSQFAIENCDL